MRTLPRPRQCLSLQPHPKRNLLMTTPQSDASAIPPEQEAGGKMSFFEHLVDLRKRLINSAIAIAVGAMLGVRISQKVIGFISRPMQEALRRQHLEDKLIYTSPAGLINIIITFGIYIGVVLAAPFWLYQVWLFMLNFLIGFQGPFKPLISINEYFDFILIVLLGLGIIFEMPVMIFFLALFNIVTPQFLWKNLRYAILIIAVVAAIVTPTPDATTMLVFMAPMVALYFIGIGVAALVVRRKAKAAAIVGGGAG